LNLRRFHKKHDVVFKESVAILFNGGHVFYAYSRALN